MHDNTHEARNGARHARHHLRPSAAVAALRHLWSSAVNDAAIELLDPSEGDHVLELGAGLGPATGGLAARVGPGGRVIAVDPTRAMRLVLRVRRQWMTNRRSIEVRNGTGEALPVADSSIDRLIGLNVLHHLDDVAASAGEAARVLRPGARLVLLDEDFGDPAHSFAQATGGHHDGPTLATPEHLTSVLTTAGFAEVVVESTLVGGEPALLVIASR